MPVRRNFYKKGNQKKEDLKRIENLAWAYGVIHPKLRISLFHNKQQIMIKTACESLLKCCQQFFGLGISQNLELQHFEFDENTIFEVILPKNSKNEECFRSNSEKTLIFANKRPIFHKQIEKILRNTYQEKFPCGILNLKIAQDKIDINLESNKTQVLIEKENILLEFLKHELDSNCLKAENETQKQITKCSGDKQNFELIEENSVAKEKLPNFKEIKISNSTKTFSPPTHESNWDRFLGSNSPKNQEICVQGSKSFVNMTPTHDEYEENRGHKETNWKRFVVPQAQKSVDKSLERSDSDVNSTKNTEISAEKGPWWRLEVPEDLENIPKVPKRSENQQDFSKNAENSRCSMKENSEISPEISKKQEKLEKYIEANIQKSPEMPKNKENLAEKSWSKGNLFGSEPISVFVNKQTCSRPKEKLFNVNKNAQNFEFEDDENLIDDPQWNPNQMNLSKPKQVLITSFSGDQENTKKRKLEFSQETPKKLPKRKPKLFEESYHEQSVADMLDKVQNYIPEKKKPQKEIGFDLNKVANFNMKTSFENESNSIIGQLKPSGFWIVQLEQENLVLLNHSRVQEIVTFKRLMQSHKLLSSPREKIIEIFQEKRWDNSLEETLEKLFNGKEIISDPRLVLNGLKVKKIQEVAKIVETSPKIPLMGISDLIEILKVIKNNPNAKIEECRPFKVIAFLKMEVKRINSQVAPNVDQEMVQEMVKMIEMEKIDMCIHSKPLFQKII